MPHNNIIDKDCQRRSGQNCQAIFPYIPIFSGGNAVFLAQKNFSAKPFACFKEPIAWNFVGPFKPIDISFCLEIDLSDKCESVSAERRCRASINRKHRNTKLPKGKKSKSLKKRGKKGREALSTHRNSTREFRSKYKKKVRLRRARRVFAIVRLLRKDLNSVEYIGKKAISILAPSVLDNEHDFHDQFLKNTDSVCDVPETFLAASVRTCLELHMDQTDKHDILGVSNYCDKDIALELAILEERFRKEPGHYGQMFLTEDCYRGFKSFDHATGNADSDKDEDKARGESPADASDGGAAEETVGDTPADSSDSGAVEETGCDPLADASDSVAAEETVPGAPDAETMQELMEGVDGEEEDKKGKALEEAFGISSLETRLPEDQLPKVDIKLGFANKNVYVSGKYVGKERPRYHVRIRDYTFKFTVADLVNPDVIDEVFKTLGSTSRSRKFKPSELILSLGQVIEQQRPANGTMCISSISRCVRDDFDISSNSIISWMADPDFTRDFVDYSSVLMQMIYFESKRLALMSNDAVTRKVLSFLKLHSYDDIVIQDGSYVQAYVQSGNYYDTSGSGALRKSKRPDGHKHRGETRNHQLKYHSAYSLSTMTPVYIHITEGTGAENHNVNYGVLKNMGKVLFCGDRIYLDFINIINLQENGIDFVIREATGCQFKIQECRTNQGFVLNELAGHKINSKEVIQAAAKYGQIETMVIAQRSIELHRLPEHFIGTYSATPKKPDQKSVTTTADKPVRVNVYYNDAVKAEEQDSLPQHNRRDQCMYIITSLDWNLASLDEIYELYKLRWDVELYFKYLKEGHGLFKVNAWRLESIINVHISAFNFAAMEALSFHSAGCLLPDKYELLSYEDESKQLMAAKIGASRKLSELFRLLKAISMIIEYRRPGFSVILSAAATDEELKYYDKDLLKTRRFISSSSLPGLVGSHDPRLNCLIKPEENLVPVLELAYEGDTEALNTLTLLDEVMAEQGYRKFNSAAKIREISKQCIALGISFQHVWKRVPPAPAISRLKTGFHLKSSDFYRTCKISVSDESEQTMGLEPKQEATSDFNRKFYDLMADQARYIADNFCYSRPNLSAWERGNFKYFRLRHIELEALRMMRLSRYPPASNEDIDWHLSLS